MSTLINSLEELFANIIIWFLRILKIKTTIPINYDIAIDETIKIYLYSGSAIFIGIGILAWVKRMFK